MDVRVRLQHGLYFKINDCSAIQDTKPCGVRTKAWREYKHGELDSLDTPYRRARLVRDILSRVVPCEYPRFERFGTAIVCLSWSKNCCGVNIIFWHNCFCFFCFFCGGRFSMTNHMTIRSERE